MKIILKDLVSDDFISSVGVVSSARGLRRHLYKSKYVDDVKKALEGGALSEEDIRQFSAELMSDFERGIRYPHELALAALSVVLETRKTEFAEEFLLDLARLNITEMTFSPEVARESIKLWSKLPRFKYRQKQYSAKRNSALANRLWRKRIVALQGNNSSKVVRFKRDRNAAA